MSYVAAAAAISLPPLSCCTLVLCCCCCCCCCCCHPFSFSQLLHFYFSGSGYFINNLLLFVTAYLLIYAILLITLARANVVEVANASGPEDINTVNLNFILQ